MPQAHYLKAVLLHFFVIWLLYGIKRLTAGLVLSDDAFADFMREPSPLPDNRQVERRAQPSLPVPGAAESPLALTGADRWPTEEDHTFHDINKLSLQQRERADARGGNNT